MLVTSAVALAEKLPDPELRPHGFQLEKGELLDLEETTAQLVACGYERVDQVEERGQFALRGDILDVYPATEERAVRCELFDIEIERLTYFSTFTQRSLEEAERVEIAPAAELAPEQRELAEIAATAGGARAPGRRRGAAGRPLPRAARPDPARTRSSPSPPRRSWRRRCATTGRTSPTSFHDEDAGHLYVAPERLERDARRARARLRLSSISQDQPHEFRAQAADTAARSLREAEPELEKLVRSGYRTIVAWARRGEAERASYNLDRVRAAFLDGKPAPREPGVVVRSREPARGLPGAEPEARDRARAPAAAPSPRREPPRRAAHRRGRDQLLHRAARRLAGRPRGPRHRELRRLRDQDRRRPHPRLPRARVPRRRPRLRAQRPAAQDQPLRRRRRRRSAAVEARRQAVGAAEAACPARGRGARRRADQPLRRAQAPRRLRLPARLASGRSSSRRSSPTARRPTSSTRSRPCARTWRRRGRWIA